MTRNKFFIHRPLALTLAAFSLVAGCDEAELADAAADEAEVEVRSYDEEIMQEVPDFDDMCLPSLGSACAWSCVTVNKSGVPLGYASYWMYNPTMIDGECVYDWPSCIPQQGLVPKPPGKNLVVFGECGGGGGGGPLTPL